MFLAGEKQTHIAGLPPPSLLFFVALLSQGYLCVRDFTLLTTLTSCCLSGPLKIFIGIFQLLRNVLLRKDGLLVCKETLKSQENYLKAISTGYRIYTYFSTWLKHHSDWIKSFVCKNASEFLGSGEATAVLLPYVTLFYCSLLPRCFLPLMIIGGFHVILYFMVMFVAHLN